MSWIIQILNHPLATFYQETKFTVIESMLFSFPGTSLTGISKSLQWLTVLGCPDVRNFQPLTLLIVCKCHIISNLRWWAGVCSFQLKAFQNTETQLYLYLAWKWSMRFLNPTQQNRFEHGLLLAFQKSSSFKTCVCFFWPQRQCIQMMKITGFLPYWDGCAHNAAYSIFCMVC